MPPPETGKKLTPHQIALLKKWIDQGAPWQGHWAFIPPVRPRTPAVKGAAAGLHPIDAFIQARLAAEGLKPAKPADKVTLIRRVTLDLTGLPPTLAEVEAFLADTTPTAYEKVVDRLLASPQYGEHMARYWLDLARYGDTHGLHFDNERALGNIAIGSSPPSTEQAIRPFSDRAAGRRPVAERDARAARRHRLQPLQCHHERRRLHR